jgi:hypothetical protein
MYGALLLLLLLLLAPRHSAVLHTSASLTINENASPDVPLDLNVSPSQQRSEPSIASIISIESIDCMLRLRAFRSNTRTLHCCMSNT